MSPKHLVSADFVPPVVNGAGDQFTKETLAAYLTMQKAASAAGVTLEVTSGYRSYAEQATIFATKVKELGLDAASRTNARAGQSEHQLGLSLDLYDGRTLGTGFASTKAGRWLWANSYKYGFIMRYPPGSEDVVGFAYQPWHYRFVGVDVASHFGANSRETLEGYLGVS
ncbi:MAG TPA: D-alanyl-D-alanine carboxypeptidase [Propionibacteriaceae bacterium]|nr:D-alanyl-D-alanine carboxypeptidase [Propionibacteriaceae bacterium]HBY23933.1 D-alanyl-D-alanine carboxypeptidase [Propionibacteriaceae bacterium]